MVNGNERKKVYYAHAMCLYRSQAEWEEVHAIKRFFRDAKIINPADYSNHPEKRADTMGFCLRLVEGSDVVVFSRLLEKVTAGVGMEVNHALKLERPVLELIGKKIVKQANPVKYITRSDTKALYKKWRFTQQ